MADAPSCAPSCGAFAFVVLALVVLLVGGTIGYVVFEGVSAWNGFLWALDTIATEGARNRPETVGGEITWVVLIVLGVGTLLYALVTLMELLVSGHLRSLLDERREQRAIDSLTDHVIICGFGRVGRQVARDLRAAGERYVVIDERPEHAEDARHVGVRFIEGERLRRRDAARPPGSSARGPSSPAWTPTPRTSSSCCPRASSTPTSRSSPARRRSAPSPSSCAPAPPASSRPTARAAPRWRASR